MSGEVKLLAGAAAAAAAAVSGCPMPSVRIGVR